MDEATGSSEVLHGSPRNNDLLALICNVINPSCSANQSGIAGANIVVTAGIADDIIPNLPNTAVRSLFLNFEIHSIAIEANERRKYAEVWQCS